MVRSRDNLVGAYAFLVGVLLAVIFGLLAKSPERASPYFYSLLVLIGIVVGFAKASDESSNIFLLASLSLIIVAALGANPLIFISQNNYVVNSLRNVLFSLLVLFVPVTIIVALKTVFSMAKI